MPCCSRNCSGTPYKLQLPPTRCGVPSQFVVIGTGNASMNDIYSCCDSRSDKKGSSAYHILPQVYLFCFAKAFSAIIHPIPIHIRQENEPLSFFCDGCVVNLHQSIVRRRPRSPAALFIEVFFLASVLCL